MTTITHHRITRLTQDKVKASACINLNGKAHKVSYIVQGSSLYGGMEPFLALALLPSMVVKEPIELDKRISPRLLANIETIQAIYHNWNPMFHPIAINLPAKNRFENILPGKIPARLNAALHSRIPALFNRLPGKGAEAPAKPRPQGKRKVACFFSGGVDSFYTLLKHSAEIDTVIFVSGGFDIFPHPDNAGLRQALGERLRRVAQQMGKEFIEVEAHIQNYSDIYVNWVWYYGSGMAALAHLLSNRFYKFYIASSMDYQSLDPKGASPLVDYLWGSEKIELVHDGCESSRVQKIVQISSSEIALNNLRVCTDYGQNRQYNCGKCNKCLMVMLVLRAVGKLDECPVFASPFNLAAISNPSMAWKSAFHFAFWWQALSLAEENGNDPELIQAIRTCLASERNLNSKINYLYDSIKTYPARFAIQTNWARSLEENNILLTRQFEAATAWAHNLAEQLKK